MKLHASHKPFDSAAHDSVAFAFHLQPHFSRAIDVEIFIEDALDFGP